MTKPDIPEPANDTLDIAVTTAADADVPVEPQEDVNRPSEELTLEAPSSSAETGMDLSASQRLKTVRALNTDVHSSSRPPEVPAANDSPADAPSSPDSIEDQINTSMTQTLRALNVSAPISQETTDNDDEESAKSGFFSRFKRS